MRIKTDDDEQEDCAIVYRLRLTLWHRLNIDMSETYTHLIVRIHDEIEVWKRLSKQHGEYKGE